MECCGKRVCGPPKGTLRHVAFANRPSDCSRAKHRRHSHSQTVISRFASTVESGGIGDAFLWRFANEGEQQRNHFCYVFCSGGAAAGGSFGNAEDDIEYQLAQAVKSEDYLCASPPLPTTPDEGVEMI